MGLKVPAQTGAGMRERQAGARTWGRAQRGLRVGWERVTGTSRAEPERRLHEGRDYAGAGAEAQGRARGVAK